MYQKFTKYLIDFSISLVLLIITLPITVITALILYYVNGGSVFFFQKRPGFKCKPFMIIKFKTMNDMLDKNGNLLPDDKRLTSFGKLVRKLSIDELPQLINVLKGELSLVGPRPLLMEYLPLYNTEQIKRHDVKPGITGWAQINGRNAISWPRKFELDLWYVQNISFFLDVRIILLTIKKVIIPEGIHSEHSATMEKFTGN